MKEVTFLTQRHVELLKYMKSHFTLIHMSNLFFRDFHYGIMSYLKEHGMKTKYHAAERIAREVGRYYEEQGIFKRIDHQSWLLLYPAFALPRIEKKAS